MKEYAIGASHGYPWLRSHYLAIKYPCRLALSLYYGVFFHRNISSKILKSTSLLLCASFHRFVVFIPCSSVFHNNSLNFDLRRTCYSFHLIYLSRHHHRVLAICMFSPSKVLSPKPKDRHTYVRRAPV